MNLFVIQTSNLRNNSIHYNFSEESSRFINHVQLNVADLNQIYIVFESRCHQNKLYKWKYVITSDLKPWTKPQDDSHSFRQIVKRNIFPMRLSLRLDHILWFSEFLHYSDALVWLTKLKDLFPSFLMSS